MHSGYIRVYLPEHPRASHGYILEHMLVVERALGKPLPLTAEVHHIDGDHANNTNSNLVVCENGSYHMLLHQRQRALAACGDPSAPACARGVWRPFCASLQILPPV